MALSFSLPCGLLRFACLDAEAHDRGMRPLFIVLNTCGRIKGRYINDSEVEVSPEAICIAISNDDLAQAIAEMRQHQFLTDNTAGRYDYWQTHQGRIELAWVRPNSGSGNIHSRLLHEEQP